MSVVSSKMARTQTEVQLRMLIPMIRIDAEPEVTVKPPDMTVAVEPNGQVATTASGSPAP